MIQPLEQFLRGRFLLLGGILSSFATFAHVLVTFVFDVGPPGISQGTAAFLTAVVIVRCYASMLIKYEDTKLNKNELKRSRTRWLGAWIVFMVCYLFFSLVLVYPNKKTGNREVKGYQYTHDIAFIMNNAFPGNKFDKNTGDETLLASCNWEQKSVWTETSIGVMNSLGVILYEGCFASGTVTLAIGRE
jgi:hypothetical protein